MDAAFSNITIKLINRLELLTYIQRKLPGVTMSAYSPKEWCGAMSDSPSSDSFVCDLPVYDSSLVSVETRSVSKLTSAKLSSATSARSTTVSGTPSIKPPIKPPIKKLSFGSQEAGLNHCEDVHHFANGRTIYFTVATQQRRPLLTRNLSREALHTVLKRVRHDYSFRIDAWVLLPDHIHTIWTLPENDNDYRVRWRRIQEGFYRFTHAVFSKDISLSLPASYQGQSQIWQQTLRQHKIKDLKDFRLHLDYIHFNPVKHGLVACAKDWPYSTFHRYVREGVYGSDWRGTVKPGAINLDS